MSIWSSNTVYAGIVAMVASSIGGCSHPVDAVVLPIEQSVCELNRTVSRSNLSPIPGTKLKIKSRGVVMEKSF